MNGSTINGDAFVGVSGNPDVVITSKANVSITGGTYPLSYEPEFPLVDIPDDVEGAASQGTIKTTNSNPYKTISASGKYDSIDLQKGELTIDEPVTLYITGVVKMGAGTSIIIGGPTDTDGDASLKLYVGGIFDAGNSNGFANNTADARRMQMFCLPSCTSVRLKNAGIFYGAIYAPNADIALDNGADVYGAIVGNSFTLKNSGTFYYDANLRDRTIYDELVRFMIHRWSED
jgi:choice-of-anchor A domain-containing protein